MKAPLAEGASELAAALAALRDDNLVIALDRLLDAWNRHRAAETAAAVERLGEVIDRSLEPVVKEGLSLKALEDRWIDIAGKRRPADVGRLMKAVGAVSARAMKVFFDELADFKPDPRMPWPAIAAASRFTSTGAGPTRTAAFKLAASVADGRIGHQPRDLTPEGVEGSSVRNWKAEVKDRIARLKGMLPPPPALEKSDRDLLDAIRSELGRLAKARPRDEAALFASASSAKASGEVTAESLIAAILADPGDEGRRLVYGDWLVERQDPRGELIVLQQKERQTGKLTGKERQRIKALIGAHGAAWIRPLDAVVKKPTFALGFLSGCSQIRFRTKQQRAELLEHPLWATVEEIDACNEERLLLGSALRSLKVLSADAPVLAKIAARPAPVPIEEVRTSISKATVDLWEKIGKVGALTRLTRLRLQPDDFGTLERKERESPRGGRWIQDSYVQDVKEYGWLLGTKLASQLVHLAIESEPAPIAGWLDKGLARLPALETFELLDTPPYVVGGLVPAGGRDIAGAPCDVRWFIRRSAGERRLRAELAIGWPYFKGRLREIGTILEINLRGFPRDDLPAVTVRYTGKRGAEFDVAQLSRDLEHLLGARFRHIELPDGRVVAKDRPHAAREGKKAQRG